VPGGGIGIQYFPVVIDERVRLTALVHEVTTAAAGANTRVGLYAAGFDWQPGALIVQGEVSAATTGIKTLSVNVILDPGRYLLAMLASSPSAQYRAWRGSQLGIVRLGGTDLPTAFAVSRSYGSLPDPGSAWNLIWTSATLGMAYFVFCVIEEP
jgi:hypothetical protein